MNKTLKRVDLPEDAQDIGELLSNIAPLVDMDSKDDILAIADWIEENADRIDAILKQMVANSGAEKMKRSV